MSLVSLRTPALSPWHERYLVAATVAGTTFLAITAGLAVVRSPLSLSPAVVVALGVLAAATYRWGVAVPNTGLFLVVLDGVPGSPLQFRPLAGDLIAQDVAVGFLLALSVLSIAARGGSFVRTKIQRVTLLWSVLLMSWWIVVVFRTILTSDVPLRRAAFFGHDFMFFALLVPVMLALFSDRSTREHFVRLAAGVLAVFATAEVLVSAQLAELSSLVHPLADFDVTGTYRLYTTMSDFVAAGFFFALGGVLFANSRWHFRLSAVLALVSLADVLLSLTRAKYLGLAVALACLCTLVLVARSGVSHRRLLTAAAVAMALLLSLVIYQPPMLQPALSSVGTRFETLAQDITGTQSGSRENTIAYRGQVIDSMEDRLGDAWPVGLGFLDPRSEYDPQLPNGSIRSVDLGMYQAVMTMGALGAVLLYFPVVAFTLAAVRSLRMRLSRDEDTWLVFGALGFCLFALASSLSLGILFSTSGLLITATVLGLGGAVVGLPRGDAERD